ncbi:hypothetical protein BASA62_002821 [Batrachochytrium salamandrivorans]|nr:hypothetical protein BASA62_002821 [Batrachochytrium salamandrivorans]
MQFFHLFSFVVVASYAAALPQPAGLSEKYSNSVDTNLASILVARSYQPGLNSQKNSATLTLLKRQDDSEGLSEDNSEDDYEDNSEGSAGDNFEESVGDNSEESSGENSGSDSSPPPDTTPATTPNRVVNVPFTNDDVSSENLASMINNVRDGGYILLGDEEEAGQRIGNHVEDMATMYLGKAAYVTAALGLWLKNSVSGILDVIESGLGEDKYSKIIRDLKKRRKSLENNFRAGSYSITIETSKLSKSTRGDVVNIMYFLSIREAFKRTIFSYTKLLLKLRNLLGKFESGKTLRGNLDDINVSIGKLLTEQTKLHTETVEKSKDVSSQW